jgi:hypothetical protein
MKHRMLDSRGAETLENKAVEVGFESFSDA